MVRYERQVLAVQDDGSIDVKGRVVSVLDSPRKGRNRITALVEIPQTEDKTSTPATFEDDSEGVEQYQLESLEPVYTKEKATFFCGHEKEGGGQCERTVDEPDETCWQHP